MDQMLGCGDGPVMVEILLRTTGPGASPALASCLRLGIREWGLLAVDMEFCYLVSIVSSQ